MGALLLGWGVGEGSTRLGVLPVSGWLVALPLGVADGEGSRFASRGGLSFCFLGVVGSVLGAVPEAVRFTPLGVALGGPGSSCGIV